jgi:hypothetical protein
MAEGQISKTDAFLDSLFFSPNPELYTVERLAAIAKRVSADIRRGTIVGSERVFVARELVRRVFRILTKGQEMMSGHDLGIGQLCQNNNAGIGKTFDGVTAVVGAICTQAILYGPDVAFEVVVPDQSAIDKYTKGQLGQTSNTYQEFVAAFGLTLVDVVANQAALKQATLMERKHSDIVLITLDGHRQLADSFDVLLPGKRNIILL